MESVKLSPAVTALRKAALTRIRPRLPPAARSALAGVGTARPLAPQPLPVLAWLPALSALAVPTTRPLLERLAAAAADLAWRQTYRADEVGPAFLARYGWAELVGPAGVWPTAAARLGFLLLGPEALYPPHAHAAEEIYLVLAGTADWRRGGEPWRPRPPGALVHHPPGLPHATRTADQPLLALYVWWGEDAGGRARIVGTGARSG
jgi:mannose-6-phosphate isomerase-like protein (cupin superfamily)